MRETFNSDANKYHRYRPNYPVELFDKLIEETELSGTSKVLEIGPGTGQATAPIAATGCEIAAIELGDQLAAKARTQLAEYKNVTILTGSFEEVTLQPLTYDLVFSATAFHWIDDAYKFSKPADILKSRKYLSIIDTVHVSDEKENAYFFASQPIYREYWPGAPEHSLPTAASLQPLTMDEDFFRLSLFDTFSMIRAYSARDYVGLVSTYSPTLALPPATQVAFLQDLETLINDKFDGTIEKHFAFTLTIAKKVS